MMKALNAIALVLIIVGGLNWGLVGLFDFNFVAAIFGTDISITNPIYSPVGLAAIYGVVLLKPVCRTGPMPWMAGTGRHGPARRGGAHTGPGHDVGREPVEPAPRAATAGGSARTCPNPRRGRTTRTLDARGPVLEGRAAFPAWGSSM